MEHLLHDPAFWVGLSFILFVSLIFKPVGRIILAALDDRAVKIQSELDEAIRLKEEAQALLSSYQRKQKEVTQNAKDIIAHAEAETKRIAKQAEKDLEDSLNKRIEVSMQKIAAYEASILQDVRNNAVDIAISTVRSLVAESISKDVAEDLISKAMADLDKKLH